MYMRIYVAANRVQNGTVVLAEHKESPDLLELTGLQTLGYPSLLKLSNQTDRAYSLGLPPPHMQNLQTYRECSIS